MEDIELKSEQVLGLFEKYRKLLKIEKYNLNTGSSYEKRVFLEIQLSGDYTKLNYSACNSMIINLVSSEGKEPYVKISGEYSSIGLNMGFSNTNKLKVLTKFIDELLRIKIHELPEYIEYLKLKEEEANLQRQKEKLEEELEKKKKEIDDKLEELKK